MSDYNYINNNYESQIVWSNHAASATTPESNISETDQVLAEHRNKLDSPEGAEYLKAKTPAEIRSIFELFEKSGIATNEYISKYSQVIANKLNTYAGNLPANTPRFMIPISGGGQEVMANPEVLDYLQRLGLVDGIISGQLLGNNSFLELFQQAAANDVFGDKAALDDSNDIEELFRLVSLDQSLQNKRESAVQTTGFRESLANHNIDYPNYASSQLEKTTRLLLALPNTEQTQPNDRTKSYLDVFQSEYGYNSEQLKQVEAVVNNYHSIIKEIPELAVISVEELLALTHFESTFNPNAVSRSGLHKGLTQISKDTAQGAREALFRAVGNRQVRLGEMLIDGSVEQISSESGKLSIENPDLSDPKMNVLLSLAHFYNLQENHKVPKSLLFSAYNEGQKKYSTIFNKIDKYNDQNLENTVNPFQSVNSKDWLAGIKEALSNVEKYLKELNPRDAIYRYYVQIATWLNKLLSNEQSYSQSIYRLSSSLTNESKG